MFFTTVFKRLRTTENVCRLVPNARLPTFDCWRHFGAGLSLSKKKECEKPRRLVAARIKQCTPQKPVFMEARGKVAIITGGTSGIGLAVAHELLHAGAFAVVCSSKENADSGATRCLNDKFGKGRAVYYPADSDFNNIFQYTLARFRRTDILFNNTGLWDDYDWEKCIDSNVGSVIRGTYAAMEYMSRSKNRCDGLVVNCGSILGFDTIPSSPAFCAAQHAIVALSECLGHRFHVQRTRVRVLTLCPKTTGTGVSFKTLKKKADPRLHPETNKWVQKQLPQSPHSVARAFIYLMNHGLSGHHYVLDGSQMTEVTLPPREAYDVPLCHYKKKRLFGLL